jgi:hypothetical protein
VLESGELLLDFRRAVERARPAPRGGGGRSSAERSGSLPRRGPAAAAWPRMLSQAHYPGACRAFPRPARVARLLGVCGGFPPSPLVTYPLPRTPPFSGLLGASGGPPRGRSRGTARPLALGGDVQRGASIPVPPSGINGACGAPPRGRFGVNPGLLSRGSSGLREAAAGAARRKVNPGFLRAGPPPESGRNGFCREGSLRSMRGGGRPAPRPRLRRGDPNSGTSIISPSPRTVITCGRPGISRGMPRRA